jgi:hypothetical protein
MAVLVKLLNLAAGLKGFIDLHNNTHKNSVILI